MKIKQLQLRNYGKFEDLTINFAPTDERASNVTVIVGNNGAGKSQILQALATGLSWFINGLRNEMDGLEIDKKLIKNGKNDVLVKIITDFKDGNYLYLFEENKFTDWQFMNVRDGRISSFKNNIYELKCVVNKYRKALTQNNALSLPLIVYYPVERSVIEASFADFVVNDLEQLEGYFSCVDGIGIDFYDFLKWFRNQEDIENELKIKQQMNNNINFHAMEAQNEGKNISDKIKNIEEKITLTTDDNIQTELRREQLTLLEELNSLLKLQVELLKTKKNNFNINFSQLKLNFIRKSIEEFTEFKNPRIRRQGTPTMIVEKDGEELDVNQLSQGEKSLLALVGDIARRLAILNPSLDDPLQGEGVVMIDEVDLHLHPKWQHDLIDKLVKTFPNVQFILTTHSPHIVSDRQDILVYSLDNGQLQTIGNVYGEDANTILNNVFNVPYRTPEIDKAFNDIRRAISHQELESAESQINNIAKKVSSSNTELLKVKLMLAQAKLAQNKVS